MKGIYPQKFCTSNISYKHTWVHWNLQNDYNNSYVLDKVHSATLHNCTIAKDIITVDPQLSKPQVSSSLDCPEWVKTVQLKCFAKTVRFIRAF